MVTPQLIALGALRVVARTADQLTLDPVGLIDLTDHVRDRQVSWTAPSAGYWRLVAFWMRGTAQIQNMFNMNKRTPMLTDPVPYVTNIYGRAGAQACVDFCDTHILPPRVRALLLRTGDAIFEDSLEMAAEQHWSPTLAAEFRRRRGYDLLPLLAAMAARPSGGAPAVLGSPPGPYALAGVDSARCCTISPARSPKCMPRTGLRRSRPGHDR